MSWSPSGSPTDPVASIAYLTGGNCALSRRRRSTPPAEAAAPGSTTSGRPQSGPGGSKSAAKARGGQDKGQRSEMARVRRGRPDRSPDAHRARFPGRHDQGHHRGGREPADRAPGASCGSGHDFATRLVRPPSGPDGVPLRWRGGPVTRLSGWPGRPGRSGRASTARRPWPLPVGPGFTAVLPPGTAGRVPEQARKSGAGERGQLLDGEWEVLGGSGTTWCGPTGSVDPVTGRRSAPERYAFRIDHRSEEQTGNIKQVWEISRLQHLTLLAEAWFLSHDEAYADRVAEQLRSWWQENPFLSGVNWTSGIETRHPPDQPGLDPAPARRLAGRRRPVRAQPARGQPRSAGISSTWPRSPAADHRLTTMSSPRPPDSWSRAAPFRWFAESARWRQRISAAAGTGADQ